MSEKINNIFRTVQAETQCPFAKSAIITFARPIAAELSLPEAAQQLHEDIIAYVREGIVTAPDGLAVALPNTFIGDDFKSLASGFKSLYHALKINDGYNEGALASEDIEDVGWQLTISGQRLFTIVFSSLYSPANPRHIHETNTTFVFFQPVQSFNTRMPFDKDSVEFKRIKASIRSRFAEAGRPYDGTINDDPREAAKYISPQHLGMKAVEWWKSDLPVQEYSQDKGVSVVESIKSSFLEYHQGNGFTTHKSFPLVIDDPTVLFTNATITPFKSMFSGDADFSNFALVQKCLRLGGTGGTVDRARSDINYTSLFDMLGSGFFNVRHDEALDYFVDVLDVLGLDRKKLIFSSIGGHALGAALSSSVLDPNQVRIVDPASVQHEWSFGEGDLRGRGVIAWFASEGYDQNPELSDCLQIGRIVHIDGISKGTSVIPFKHTAFDVGIGLGRVERALTGENEVTMKQWRILSEQFKNSFDGISEGDAHYMANLCRVTDELTSEGLMPGNKKHSYVLRKIIRSLIEEVWLQSGDFVNVENVLQFFIEGAMSKSGVMAAISDEESALRKILSEVVSKRNKHPEMTLSDLHSTFGIRPNLLSLM